MLEKDEFENWIKASHTLFEIFEGRYDAYPLARKWVQEWLSFKEFAIEKEDLTIINGFIEDFDYDVFRNFRHESERDDDYWERLKKRIIDLEFYFKQLGIFLESKKSELEVFKDKRLISDQIDTNEVKRIFEEINTKLKESGIGHNEPVGTAKLLHIFAPYYFPLIDNSEAQAIGLINYGESMSSNHYLTWMIKLKEWLRNYRELIEKLEREHHSSIIKLADEGLYIMSTVKQKTRVAELGLWVG